MAFDHEEIRRLRTRLGCSQREFAKRVGVPQSTILRWETGEMAPSATSLGRLADLAREHGVVFRPLDGSEPPRNPEEAVEWLRRTPVPLDQEAQKAWREEVESFTRVVAPSPEHAGAFRRALDASARTLRQIARAVRLAESPSCASCRRTEPDQLYRGPDDRVLCLDCLRSEPA